MSRCMPCSRNGMEAMWLQDSEWGPSQEEVAGGQSGVSKVSAKTSCIMGIRWVNTGSLKESGSILGGY